MWAFMKAFKFESLNSDHIKMCTTKVGEGQPQRFIPVFDSREDAEQFAGEEDKNLICEIRLA